jgi:hypothetical protein
MLTDSELEAAVAWARMIELMLDGDYRITPEEYQPELARVMQKAAALRLALRIICKEDDEDIDELIEIATKTIEGKHLQ